MKEQKLRLTPEIEQFFTELSKVSVLTPVDIIRTAVNKARRESPDLSKFTPQPCDGNPRAFVLDRQHDPAYLRRVLTWFVRTTPIPKPVVIRISKSDAQWLNQYPIPKGTVVEIVD